MQIVVGSKNPVKHAAVRQAFSLYFDKITISSINVDSGIQPFPMTEAETLQGAINRAKQAYKKVPLADFSVGIEGGLFKFNNAFYIQAIVAVLKGNKMCVARSVAVEISHSIVDQINPSSDLSKKIVDKLMRSNNLFQNEGIIGVLTQNRLLRTQVLRDAVICALPRFLLPQFYPE